MAYTRLTMMMMVVVVVFIAGRMARSRCAQ